MKHKFFEQKKKEASIKDKELQWFAEKSILSCIEDVYGDGVETLFDQSRKPQKAVSPAHPKIQFVGGGFAIK